MFVDPESDSLFLARFAEVNQVEKSRFIDAALSHSQPRMKRHDNLPLKAVAVHPPTLNAEARGDENRISLFGGLYRDLRTVVVLAGVILLAAYLTARREHRADRTLRSG